MASNDEPRCLYRRNPVPSRRPYEKWCAALLSLSLFFLLCAPINVAHADSAVPTEIEECPFGKIVPEALKACQAAADRGSPHAQSLIGSLYHSGTLYPKDLPLAAKWYRKAAEQGDTAAQVMLARMYARGEGVPIDLVEAHAWTSVVLTKDPKTDSFLKQSPVFASLPEVKTVLEKRMSFFERWAARQRFNKYLNKATSNMSETK